MKALAKVLGRLLAMLVSNNVISYEQGEWILEPAEEFLDKYKAESEE